jgi:hypothetical protein
MGSLRSMREEARREKRETKNALVGRIDALMELYGKDRDYLARIVDELNSQNIRTLNGMTWTTRNLWQFLATNEPSFEQAGRSETLPAIIPGQEAIEAPRKDFRQDLDQLLDWARQYRKYGVVPLVIRDEKLLEKIEARLEEKHISLSDLVTELLEGWLKEETEPLLLPETAQGKSGRKAGAQKQASKKKGGV